MAEARYDSTMTATLDCSVVIASFLQKFFGGQVGAIIVEIHLATARSIAGKVVHFVIGYHC